MSQPSFDPTQVRAIMDAIEQALQPGADADTKAKAARACAGLASLLETETGTRSATSPAPSKHWVDRLLWLATSPQAAEVRKELFASVRELASSMAPPAQAVTVLDIPFVGNRGRLN